MYKIYPSLIDAYEWMQAADDQAAYLQRRQELLDKINRVPVEPSYAASRGTALNNILDSVIARQEVQMMSYGDHTDILLTLDGYTFAFDYSLVDNLLTYVGERPIIQPYVQSHLSTEHGDVLLYGFADYVEGDRVIDLKTTSNYTAGKYREHWQHRVYPYCLVSSGEVESVTRFDYLVAELQAGNGGSINGKVYQESYNVDVATCESELRTALDSGLLAFIEDNRHLITDGKIFGT